jgi:hypothetical protein
MIREFKMVRSTSQMYEVQCKNDGCPWLVHAYKGKWRDYWECSIVGEHTCILQSMEKYYHNNTSQLIVDEMYGMIVDNLAYEPRSMTIHKEEV